MSVFGGPRGDVVDETRGTYFAPAPPAYIGSSASPVVTTTSAAQSIAIRSTTDLIASLGSELPIKVFTKKNGKQVEVDVPSNLEDPGGDGRGREDWGYRVFNGWLYAGNTFGDAVEWRGSTLWTCDLINPNQVSPSVVDGQAKWYINGREVTKPKNFLHWRVNPVPGYLLGLSPIEQAAANIGVSLATTRFGREFFTDGLHPGGLITNELTDLDDEQVVVTKNRVQANKGMREPLVLGKGWKWQDVQVTPEESQFIETQGWSEAQCARIYGPGFAEILGYETGQKMTYNNVVERRQDLLVLGVNRWFRRYERILSLFVPKGQWVELTRDALLETTTLQRYQAHASALRAGWKVPNEVREIENLEPTEWGKQPVAGGSQPDPVDPTKES